MFNLNSTHDLSILFFGGLIKKESIEPILENGIPLVFKSGIKTGQLRTKKVEKLIKIKGLGLTPLKEWKTKKPGIYQTNEKVLELISLKDNDAGKIAKLILELRGLEKQVSTYYSEDYIYPDNKIHPNFNLVSTDTGRTSCNKPNIQNQPAQDESKVKQHFVSRFGSSGAFVKIDYSQIEVVVQAQISGDKKYMNDVKQGIDFHCKRLALKENIPYEVVMQKVKIEKDAEWILKRSHVKSFSFSRAYGAGAVKIAADTGMSEEEVKELIKNEDLEYDKLRQFNDRLMAMVEFTAGEFCHERLATGWYNSPTNRRYSFNNEEAPAWLKRRGQIFSFKPTKIKNYIVQGTAYDIVSMMIGFFWRRCAQFSRDRYLLISFVHDELDIDCKAVQIEALEEDAKLLTAVPLLMKEYFNYKWELPVNIDIKIGDSWHDL